jgi:hypothetical protein
MNSAQMKAIALKVLPALLLAMLLLSVDIAVNKPDTANAVSDLLPVLPKSRDMVNNDTKVAETLQLYQTFDAPKADVSAEPETETVSAGLTQEQQQQQQGLLQVLYIDDEKYRLSAIINQGRYVAVLTVTNTNNEALPSRRLLLGQGDNLQQYQVVAVTSRRITLRHQQRELWLQLFTPVPAQPAES